MAYNSNCAVVRGFVQSSHSGDDWRLRVSICCYGSSYRELYADDGQILWSATPACLRLTTPVSRTVCRRLLSAAFCCANSWQTFHQMKYCTRTLLRSRAYIIYAPSLFLQFYSQEIVGKWVAFYSIWQSDTVTKDWISVKYKQYKTQHKTCTIWTDEAGLKSKLEERKITVRGCTYLNKQRLM